MINKAWRAVTPLIIHSCFKKSGFPLPNLVDVDDTLTEFNAEPSLWEALPEQDLTFEDYVLVDTDIAVWGALSDAEIVALDYNNTKSDEDESEELTPVTLSEAKVSLNKLRNFFLQNHVDADILQASLVLEKSIDKFLYGRDTKNGVSSKATTSSSDRSWKIMRHAANLKEHIPSPSLASQNFQGPAPVLGPETTTLHDRFIVVRDFEPTIMTIQLQRPHLKDQRKADSKFLDKDQNSE
ncbi:tigger transposable element-derived protein 6 [Trichonephila clavipes]|uniref:Tigger transposable element-derived protein 6 n=1 Tax=Trichonephila clavipes TaxID=2585209 RepID=A0A8X6V374_TRICX|nr:tigger transposable element-derived protein 6 [Trichonephila clavipes]